MKKMFISVYECRSRPIRNGSQTGSKFRIAEVEMNFNWEIKFRMLTVNISRRVRDMKTEMDVKPEVDYISRKNHFHVPEAITNIQKIFQNVNLKLEKW